ncbi:MAG: LysR family transcriptional regulator [Clostridiales bacterium]|nr:LysR family transcriptional regulator [Clostridiales bacterium]MBQ3019841.1 LysR family transcriptional regulator [Clostridia bacterium]
MNTEELKTFIFLSKVKNFTLAAEQLFIAQSTVTNRISELEKEVGKKLFSRGAKTVKLTEAGEIFLRYAERILELQSTSIEEMNALSSHSRKFSIGAINATYETYVKPLVDECLKDNTVTSVKVMLGHSLDLIQHLQDNMLDMVFSAIPLKRIGFNCDVFDVDRVTLVCKKGANEYPDGVTKEQLAKLPYLMCDFTLSEAGVFIRSLFPRNHIFRLDVDNSSKLLPYLENGLGYSFLPYKLIKDKLDAGVLEEVALKDFNAPNVTTYLIYRQNYDISRFLENKFDKE